MLENTVEKHYYPLRPTWEIEKLELGEKYLGTKKLITIFFKDFCRTLSKTEFNL